MSYDSVRNPEKYVGPAWPPAGFWKSEAMMGNGICRMCEDGEHTSCLDMTEEHNECSCATGGHKE